MCLHLWEIAVALLIESRKEKPKNYRIKLQIGLRSTPYIHVAAIANAGKAAK
jgi:hypothetical protein